MAAGKERAGFVGLLDLEPTMCFALLFVVVAVVLCFVLGFE